MSSSVRQSIVVRHIMDDIDNVFFLLVFVTQGSPLALEDVSSPRVPLWVQMIFQHQGSPLGFPVFYLTRVPLLVWKILHHHSRVSASVSQFFVSQGSPLGFGRFYTTKRFPLGFAGFCHPRFPHRFGRFYITKDLLLGFTGFLLPKGPTCLEDFTSPRIPLWVQMIFQH